MSNEYVDMVRDELQAVGIAPQIEHGGKHLIARWEHNGAPRRHVMPASGSDWRGLRNSRADIRRMLKDDGLLAVDQEPAALEAVNIFPRSGSAWCSSIDIAVKFEKAHKDVLRSIDRAVEDLGPEYAERNFAPSSYTDPSGRSLRAFDLTRDGFSLVAMGFTGSKAMAWKVRYLEAFSAMETELQAGAAHLSGRVQHLEGEVAALADLLLEQKPAVSVARQIFVPPAVLRRRAERRLGRIAK